MIPVLARWAEVSWMSHGACQAAWFFLETSLPITSQQLLQILPNPGKQAGVFTPRENYACNR